jgi:chemotaxis protein methyltransferase CheR
VSDDGFSDRVSARKPPAAVQRGFDGAEMSEQVFKLYQALIQRTAGIFLVEHKRALLVRRLRGRVRALGLGSYLEYYRLVTGAGHDDELRTMLDLVTTNETRFFREPRQLAFLERELLPGFQRAALLHRRPKRLRAWCAACSSGEEPFTLAMLLARHLPVGWRREILATDLSTRMLERARQAAWPIRQVAEIPATYLEEYMLRRARPRSGNGEEALEAKPVLRAMVRFERLNLHLDLPPRGPFDLILCRNVLMYFDPATKRRVVDRLLSTLAEDGYLLVGHAESLSGLDPRLRLVAPTIYARAEHAEGRPDLRILAAGRHQAEGADAVAFAPTPEPES